MVVVSASNIAKETAVSCMNSPKIKKKKHIEHIIITQLEILITQTQLLYTKQYSFYRH